MLSVTKPAKNRLNIVIDGKIEPAEMQQALEEFLALSDEIENGLLHYSITEFALPSFAAIGVKMGLLPRLLTTVRKFDRGAVVTDAAWIRTMASVEGALIPGLALKGFAPENADAAEAWLTGADTSDAKA